MSDVELPGAPLRIAFLGDFESQHTRRWLRVFVERGHEVHAISYYRPRVELPGVKVHALQERAAPSALAAPGEGSEQRATWRSLAPRLPPSVRRPLDGARYLRAGLGRELREISPDIFHAHYAVEHGFYGALAGFHPYVVSAWGSDLLVDSYKPMGHLFAKWTLGRADLVTANDPALADRAMALGVNEGRAQLVRLGVDDLFLSPAPASVNEMAGDHRPTLISDRALEPLYKVDVVLRAFAQFLPRLPKARLLVAHDGSQRRRLEALAAELGLGEAVQFLGTLDPGSLKAALASAQIYASVPVSDSLAVSTMEAMAAGCFPIVSDLPSQDGFISDGVNGLRVKAGDVNGLATALARSFSDEELRRSVLESNRAKVAAEGRLEANMLVMERHYYWLTGRTLISDGGDAI